MHTKGDRTIEESELINSISEGTLPAGLIDVEFNELVPLGETLADLNSQVDVDALAYIEALSWESMTQQARVRMTYVLEGFAGAVRDTPPRIYSFFHSLRRHLSDSDAYHLNSGFETWAATNKEQLEELAVLFDNGEYDSPFLGSLLFCWRRHARPEALASALKFSGDIRPAMRRQAIFVLGGFDDLEKSEEAGVETRLLELVSSSDTNDQRSAIAAIIRRLAKQSHRSPRLVSALEAAASEPTPEIRHELIAGLVHHKNAYPTPLRSKVVDLMKGVQTDCGGTLDLVDLALYNMDVDKDRGTIFETLTALISQESGAPPLKALNSISHKLETGEHNAVGWYVTRWLLEGDIPVCNQLSSLFPPLTTAPYNFDLRSFALSADEVFYLAHKIYVYLLFCHGPAVSLLCECLVTLKLEQRKRLEEDIAAFWLQNFPGDLEIFEAVSKARPRKGLKASIKRLQAHVDAYQAPLRALGENVALRPSAMERRVQAELQHEQNRQVSRAAEENSIFASLFHKSTLLYGRSSVTYVYPSDADEPIRQVIPMTSFQTSSALPRMDCLYPARLNYLLYRFRREKRPQ